MSQIVEILFRNFKTHIRVISLVIFILILLALSIWCYYKYAVPSLNNNAKNQGNVPNNGTNQEVDIYFFNVDWCPHCINAKPEWITFCQNHNGKEYNGYIIKCVGGEKGTDCTESSDIQVIELIQKFNIEHYPTLKMMMGGTIIDFDGKITNDNLELFIQKVLTTGI